MRLLDTSVCVDVLRRVPWAARRLGAYGPSEVAVSVITRLELMVGAALSHAPELGRRESQRLLDTVQVLDIGPDVVDEATAVRVAVRRAGRSLGDMDLLIAATALAHDLTLVTRDRDFARVPGLRVEDWTA